MTAAARVIQRAMRRHQQKKLFKNYFKSTIIIQRWFRKVSSARALRREIEARVRMRQLTRVALVIQKNVRRRICQREYVRLRQQKIEAEMRRREKASSVIQATWRMHKQRRHYLHSLWAAKAIQTYARGYLARKRYQQYKKEDLCRKESAAIAIQTSWRAWSARKDYQVKRKAIITLQAMIRCHQEKQRFATAKQSAVIIQGWWKKTMAAHKLLQELEKRIVHRKAATVIQATWKMFSQRKSYQQTVEATIVLQTYCRAYIARQIYLKKREAQRQEKASALIQATWKMYVQRRNYLQIVWAAKTIQTQARGYMARKKYLQLKKDDLCRKELAATTIQACWRAWSAWKSYQIKRNATITLQSMVRCHQERQRFMTAKRSAVLIQGWWRKTFAARKLTQELEERSQRRKAATVIQAQWKMYHTRRSYKQLRQATIVIQTCCKGYIARQVYLQQREMLKQKKASIVIQAAWKMHVQRRNYLQIVWATKTIQTQARGYMARTKYLQLKKDDFCRKESAATTIQACWRAWSAWKSYKDKRNAAITLQSMVRCHRERQRFLTTKRSVVLIQGWWGKTMAAHKLSQELEERSSRRKAATVIQAKWKMYCRRKSYKQTVHAIIVIQAHWRGYNTRQMYLQQKELLRQENASALIQATWKMHVQRKWYQNILLAVTSLQRYSRGHLARVELARLKDEQARKIEMQATLAERMAVRQQASATVIQSSWKSWVVRRHFLKMRRAAVTIQAVVRGHQTRSAIKFKLTEKVIFACTQLSKVQLNKNVFSLLQLMENVLPPAFDATYTSSPSGSAAGSGVDSPSARRVSVPVRYSDVMELHLDVAEKIEEVRRKVKVANENASEEMKLGNRAVAALHYLYNMRDMAQLIKFLWDLGKD